MANQSGPSNPGLVQHGETLKRRIQNEAFLQQVKPGDMIEFPRKLYSHWAIYVGKGKVIHLTGDAGDMALDEAGTVKLEDFWTVVGTSTAKINNFLDVEMKPLPEKYIISNAMSKLGAEGYHLIFLNCEHFVTWCRYGKAKSSQVQHVTKVLGNFGSSLKDRLNAIASTAQNKQEKDIVSGVVSLGVTLANQGKDYMEKNEDADLKTLKQRKQSSKSTKKTRDLGEAKID